MENKNTLFYSNNQELLFDFLGTNISSDGGLFLLEKLERQFGIISSFSCLLSDKRQQGKIDFTIYDLMKLRVHGIVMGYEDCNDVSRLKEDTAFVQTCGTLASQPTLSRFENSLSATDIYRLSIGFIDRYVESLSKNRKRVIIDVDATDDPTHGNQQMSMYNGYYGHTAYTELLFHDGETGQLILPVLRPGNAHSNKWFVACMKRIVLAIRKKCPNIKIILRGDTGYAGADFFSYAKEAGICHVTGLASNERLKKITRYAQAYVKEKYLKNGLKEKVFLGPFKYQAKSWEQPLSCYVKIESTGRCILTRYYCTNIEGQEAQSLYQDFYTQRGDASENRIKELKNMCYSDRLSCHKFTANCFRLLMSSISYEILRTIREMIKKAGFVKQAKWQCSNIRLLLLKIGTQIKKTKKRIYIHFAEHYLYKDIFRSIINLC